MLLKNELNKQIIDVVNLINVILELGYIPNSKKYNKLNNLIICKTLNDYNNTFDKIFKQNLNYYYNIQ